MKLPPRGECEISEKIHEEEEGRIKEGINEGIEYEITTNLVFKYQICDEHNIFAISPHI